MRISPLVLALLCVPARPAPAPAAPASEPAPQHVDVTARLPGARDEKTLSQLLSAREAFERHHALAPDASLAFRLYARLDPGDLARLHRSWPDDAQVVFDAMDDPQPEPPP
jgi:hypothetical protein